MLALVFRLFGLCCLVLLGWVWFGLLWGGVVWCLGLWCVACCCCCSCCVVFVMVCVAVYRCVRYLYVVISGTVFYDMFFDGCVTLLLLLVVMCVFV